MVGFKPPGPIATSQPLGGEKPNANRRGVKWVTSLHNQVTCGLFERSLRPPALGYRGIALSN